MDLMRFDMCAGMKTVLAMTGLKLLNLLVVTTLLGHFTAVSAICADVDRNALLQFKSGNSHNPTQCYIIALNLYTCEFTEDCPQ